ncbi:MAG: hypothetical protein ACRC4L_03325, partial [Mycoplasma sp.]
GKNGEDMYVNVPFGTVIYDANTNEQIADINENGQQFIICKGGLKGHGNFHFFLEWIKRQVCMNEVI